MDAILEAISETEPHNTQAEFVDGIITSVVRPCTFVVERKYSHVKLDCVQLETGNEPLSLGVGDEVLLLLRPGIGCGLILGKIGRPREAAPTSDRQQPLPVPDELVLEATERITLKCGDGSITLRGDGKVLIKGKELVSHATGMNRVKGAAVAIN